MQDGVRPVRAVAERAEVRQRLLGRADLVLLLGQLVAELHEEASEALSLHAGEGQDTGEVVSQIRIPARTINKTIYT